MPIKINPSFLVIFWPVLKAKKKIVTAIIKKIRAITKGERSLYDRRPPILLGAELLA